MPSGPMRSNQRTALGTTLNRPMSEDQKIVIDVAAGTGTAAAYMDMAPNVVAIITGIWVLIRIWETKTVRKLTRRD